MFRSALSYIHRTSARILSLQATRKQGNAALVTLNIIEIFQPSTFA